MTLLTLLTLLTLFSKNLIINYYILIYNLMNRIKRYNEYSDQESMVQDFLNSLTLINENSDGSEYVGIWDSISKDLKLNIRFIATFGTGINSFYPVVDKMMKNMNISSGITVEHVVLLTICALSIIYLEEKKFKSSKEGDDITTYSKSMLEELKMMGIGNGIVKMVVKSIKSIKNIFNLIGKHIGSVVGGVIDMFAYTSLLIPIMNGVGYMVGKYDLTPETAIQNLVGIGVGLGTIVAKHGITHILDKIKGKFNIDKKDIEEIESEFNQPVIKKFETYVDSNIEPINEQ